jgi:hypothetical protein
VLQGDTHCVAADAPCLAVPAVPLTPARSKVTVTDGAVSNPWNGGVVKLIARLLTRFAWLLLPSSLRLQKRKEQSMEQ